ncbi:MAG: hypothetical protein ACI9CA_000762 [Natronomonas sp.]|jgi:hypothetical protein
MTEYELTRRDVLAALGAAGVGVAGGVALVGDDSDDGGDDRRPLAGETVATVEAVARVVYPGEVSGVSGFVEQYVIGRARDRPDHARGVADAAAALDGYARDWYDRGYLDLDPEQRETALDDMGVRVADPDPEGSPVERVRFYLVNELLYALYTTPTGAELVGLENPQGYPGGTDSYRRGP